MDPESIDFAHDGYEDRCNVSLDLEGSGRFEARISVLRIPVLYIEGHRLLHWDPLQPNRQDLVVFDV